MSDTTDRHIRRLEEEKAELERAVTELSVLNDLARMTSGVTEQDDILDRIVRSAVSAVGASEGAIFMVEDETSEMNTLVRVLPDSAIGGAYRLSTSVLGWMELNMTPIIVNDPLSDERFRGASWDTSLDSLLAVPMMVRSQMIATLVLFNREDSGGFTAEDQRLLSIIAAQSAQIIENRRLRDREGELLKMQHEMELASTIQKNLLPSESPELPGYEITGRTTQLELVGGDFYDFIPCGERSMMICLGDVSGKGLPASLLMSNVNALLRTQVAHDPSPAAALTVANNLLHNATSVDRFVTLALVLVDSQSGDITWSNAGHTKPVIIQSNGETRRMEEQDIMLGMTGNRTFEESYCRLERGGMIVLYSDGFTEAVNTEGEEFGEEMLIEYLTRLRHRELSTILEETFKVVTSYVGAERQDDMTLVLIRRK